MQVHLHHHLTWDISWWMLEKSQPSAGCDMGTMSTRFISFCTHSSAFLGSSLTPWFIIHQFLSERVLLLVLQKYWVGYRCLNMGISWLWRCPAISELSTLESYDIGSFRRSSILCSGREKPIRITLRWLKSTWMVLAGVLKIISNMNNT